MNDKELADAVMTILGEDIWYFAEWLGLETWTENHGEDALKEIIILSWVVAGALMEAKCWGINTVRKGNEWEAHVVPIGQIRESTARNESPVRAILEACVKALT